MSFAPATMKTWRTHRYGAPLEVLQHGGMPVVVEQYPDYDEEAGANVVPLREGHHEHPA